MQLVENPETDILFIEEAAPLARKSVATMYYLRSIGQGPKCGKLGRRLVYRRSDVETWIASAFEDDAQSI
jgi:predicted DNA-binding transcriptional regulator AlpA